MQYFFISGIFTAKTAGIYNIVLVVRSTTLTADLILYAKQATGQQGRSNDFGELNFLATFVILQGLEFLLFQCLGAYHGDIGVIEH